MVGAARGGEEGEEVVDEEGQRGVGDEGGDVGEVEERGLDDGVGEAGAVPPVQAARRVRVKSWLRSIGKRRS